MSKRYRVNNTILPSGKLKRPFMSRVSKRYAIKNTKWLAVHQSYIQDYHQWEIKELTVIVREQNNQINRLINLHSPR